MPKKGLMYFMALLFMSCFSHKWTSKTFLISDKMYMECRTSEYKGYTWVYLCNKETRNCINVYNGGDTITGSGLYYFPRIKSINFNKITGDTLIFSIISAYRYCISDTLLLSNGKLLSSGKSSILCPQ